MNFEVCLIAKNEEKTLPRLLASLNAFKEQGGVVRLLDTGSTDNTAEIARNWGCKVEEVGDRFVVTIDEETAKKINEMFVEDNEPLVVRPGARLFDYSSARNYIASFAETDMIATPDCDEVYTTFDLEKIQKIIAEGADQLEYNFIFSHDQFGKPVIKFKHCKFYNRNKLKWVGIIHEVLQGDAKRVFLGEDVILLEHFQNHETDRSHYLTGLALDCFINPGNDRNSHYFGRELFWSKRYRSAIKELKRHIAMEGWPAERNQSYLFMGDAYWALGLKEEAYHSYFSAINVEPKRREPYLRLASKYYEERRLLETICFAAASLEIERGNYYSNLETDYTYRPHELLYLSKWYVQGKEAARPHFDKAFNYLPLNSKFLYDYRFFYSLPSVSIILPTLGRPAGLQRCLESIKKLNYPENLIELKVIEDVPRKGVPFRMKEGVESTTGEVIVFAANDIEFTPDSLILAVLNTKKKGLVAFNTGEVGFDKGNICEHFAIRRDMLPRIGGEVFDTRFHHCGVDNLLWAKCEKLGEAMRDENAIVKHFHFSTGKSKMDEVYTLGWEKYEEDRQLLAQELAKLNEQHE